MIFLQPDLKSKRKSQVISPRNQNTRYFHCAVAAIKNTTKIPQRLQCTNIAIKTRYIIFLKEREITADGFNSTSKILPQFTTQTWVD